MDKKIPEIKAFLNKVAKVHGERHPELIEIEQLFTDSAHELLAHMEKEEKYYSLMFGKWQLTQPFNNLILEP